MILQPPIEKTPLSGPGVLKKKRGRKRRKDDTESLADEEKDSLENEYQGKWQKETGMNIGGFGNLVSWVITVTDDFECR